MVTATLSGAAIHDIHDICQTQKAFFDSSAYVTSPNTALLHDLCETEVVNNGYLLL
jgi:hypothetical protein